MDNMCFPSPGPRCSHHAHREYLTALKKAEGDTSSAAAAMLQEKMEGFHSTPRGQNELRREAAKQAPNSPEQTRLLAMLRRGEEVRAQQLRDFSATQLKRNTGFRDIAKSRGVSLNKYVEATGIAAMYLEERFPTAPLKVESKDTLLIGSERVLVLPPKYQRAFGTATLGSSGWASDDTRLNEWLDQQELGTLGADLGPVGKWWVDELARRRYTAVASVNPLTGDVAVSPVEKVLEAYTLSLSTPKRLGGTAPYRSDLETVKAALVGTPFEGGQVIDAQKVKQVIVAGVPRQPASLSRLSGGLYLGWREADTSEGGYYEVRRSHESNSVDLVVKLNVREVLLDSGVAEGALPSLRKAHAL